MSDSLDPRLLGPMLARLKATTEEARREQMALCATFDAVSGTSNAQFNEMIVRLSNMELAEPRISERFDELAGKVDCILMMLGG